MGPTPQNLLERMGFDACRLCGGKPFKTDDKGTVCERCARRAVNGEPFQRDTEPTGRNDLCPCGSGKKFKRCCLPKMRKARMVPY